VSNVPVLDGRARVALTPHSENLSQFLIKSH
jgi:hypothetical protein